MSNVLALLRMFTFYEKISPHKYLHKSICKPNKTLQKEILKLKVISVVGEIIKLNEWNERKDERLKCLIMLTSALQ